MPIKYLSESILIQLKNAETEKRGGRQPINFQFSVPFTTFFVSILCKFVFNLDFIL